MDRAIDQVFRNVTSTSSPDQIAAVTQGAMANIAISSAMAEKALQALYEDASKAGADYASGQIGYEAVLGDRVQQMLGQTKQTIKAINDTTLQRIRQAIYNGVTSGKSAAQIGEDLKGVVAGLPGNPKELNNPVTRADVIASTEANRAYNVAALDTYQASGVGGWNWVAYDSACDECLNIEASNPHSFDEELTPPDHPNCMCTVEAVQENQ
jgi:hypothetical protein